MCRRVTPNRHVSAFLSLCQFREFDALLQQRIRRVFRLLFDPCDLSPQPAGKGFFQLKLRAAAIEIVNGLALFTEGNKPARRALALQFTGNELYQSTLAARMCPSGIAQIRTTGGVFQDVWRTPGCPGRPPVASIFYEVQLKLQKLQHFVLIVCHTSPRDMGIASQNAVWVAMIVVTWFRDLDHKCAAPLESERFHVITVTLSGARPPWVEVRGRQ